MSVEAHINNWYMDCGQQCMTHRRFRSVFAVLIMKVLLDNSITLPPWPRKFS